MHVLVTGVSGFVGPELVKELLQKNFHVTCTFRQNQPKDVESLLNNENFKLVQCDLLDELQVNSLFEQNTFDAVFHLAGQTFRKDNSKPYIYFQSNFNTTLNLLECCRNYNVKKFVFSSSIATYGLSPGQNMPEYLPVDENHTSIPYDFYDLSKYFAEKLCSYYYERFGIISSILRYSRIFGPLMDKGLFYVVTKNALQNNPITINGDVSTDFVYVDDVVKANILAFENSNKFDIFNIGSGDEITLFEIAQEIIDITKSKSEIIFNAEPKSKFSLDISKAKKLLNYSSTPTKQGLKDVVNYIQNITNV